ncbi:phage terminase small subunit [Pseudoalteromonas luteoviolacea]|uniref:phage terminase small subunit n=1 Tax=Pseudoalteromonas luteoviolacea TaxID=43657 RepID=UPI001B36BC8C|nr:phage terminase small subunit [Pseudoalteromonas luteoviolacea]MBQ4836786.1 terminase [Pseudoalteromonas luteoviolacea]
MSLVKNLLANASSVPKSNMEEAPAKRQVVQTDNTSHREYDIFAAAINADLAQLKKLGDLSRKHDYKAQALERNDYLGYINGYRLRQEHFPNKVLARVFIWLVDLKRWNQALELFPLLISQNQPLPFNSGSWASFLAGEVYEHANWFLNNKCNSDDQAYTAFILARIIDVVKDHDWTGREIAGGKLYAIAMKLEAAQNNFGNAIRYGRLAQKINDKAGVKIALEKLEKKYATDERKETTQSQPQEA